MTSWQMVSCGSCKRCPSGVPSYGHTPTTTSATLAPASSSLPPHLPPPASCRQLLVPRPAHHRRIR